MLQWPLESLIEKNMTKKRNRSATWQKKKIVLDNHKRCMIKNLGPREGEIVLSLEKLRFV